MFTPQKLRNKGCLSKYFFHLTSPSPTSSSSSSIEKVHQNVKFEEIQDTSNIPKLKKKMFKCYCRDSNPFLRVSHPLLY